MIILKFKWQICIVLDLGRQANENVGDIFEFVFIICPLEIRMSTLEIELVLFKPVCLAEGSNYLPSAAYIKQPIPKTHARGRRTVYLKATSSTRRPVRPDDAAASCTLAPASNQGNANQLHLPVASKQ